MPSEDLPVSHAKAAAREPRTTGRSPTLDPTDASGTVVKLKSKVSALAVVPSDEVDEQLTRQKHGHVGERVNDIEVDVVDFNLGESKLDDSFGTNEGGFGPPEVKATSFGQQLSGDE